jgi:hypothetical protein
MPTSWLATLARRRNLRSADDGVAVDVRLTCQVCLFFQQVDFIFNWPTLRSSTAISPSCSAVGTASTTYR